METLVSDPTPRRGIRIYTLPCPSPNEPLPRTELTWCGAPTPLLLASPGSVHLVTTCPSTDTRNLPEQIPPPCLTVIGGGGLSHPGSLLEAQCPAHDRYSINTHWKKEVGSQSTESFIARFSRRISRWAPLALVLGCPCFCSPACRPAPACPTHPHPTHSPRSPHSS